MGANDQGDTSGGGGDSDARSAGGGPGRDAGADKFDALFECLRGIGEAGAKAREFLETGRLLLVDEASVLPRRGEAVAYCVRQAADSILESAGSSPEDRSWRVLSRKVVSAKKVYERAKRFGEDGLEDALAGLLADIDALDEFHNEAPTRSEKQAAAVHARLTGSHTVGGGLGPVRDFLKVRDKAAGRLHGTCPAVEAERLLEECVDAMLGFLRSTADKSADLAELAGRVSPGEAELEESRRLIVDAGDLDAFLDSAADPAWLELLYGDGRLGLPASPTGRWVARTAAIRLSGTHRQQVADWLEAVAGEDRDDPARCAAVVDVLLSMDSPEFEAALDIAAPHPRDGSMLWHFARALEGVDSSDPIVERCAAIFLRALTPEGQPAEQPAGPGWNRISDDLIDLLRMLADGADEQNAQTRIRLLLANLESMPSEHGFRSLYPIGGNRLLSISSLAEGDPDGHFGEQRDTIGVFLVRIMAKAIGWLPAAELLELAEEAPVELAGRLRTWILAAAADSDPEEMAVEIEEAIGSRLPNCDDVALLDRISAEVGADRVADRFRAALGEPPSVAEASEALGSEGLLPDWRFPYVWSGLLPEAAAAAWADAAATHILAAQIGSPETRDYYLGLRDDPDSDMMAGWVQSPLSAEHLRSLGPEQAADEMAAWRPQPHDSPSAILLIADVLKQLVRDDPAGWLAEPLPVAVRLRHPTYIARYLRTASHAAKENPAAFGQATVPGLIDVITMAQREPWPAEPLGVGGQRAERYDTSWDQTRLAGTDLIKTLLDSRIGLAGRDGEVWDYLDAEARTNPHIFEAGQIGAGFDDDPVGYMLDNAGRDNRPSDPLHLAINQAGTRAVDAALSFMAAEHRATGDVRTEAAGLLEWCLNLDGLEGAKHRAVIAPNAGLLSRILPDWFDQNHSLLFGEDAPGRLGQLTIDVAVRWSRPWEWLLVNHRDGIYDSAARGADRSLDWPLIAMLHRYDGYAPPQIVRRLAGKLPEACGALAGLIDRTDEPTADQMEALLEFCDTVVGHDGGQHAAALGRMAYADCFDHDTWTDITLKALEATGGYIGQAHKITRRILDNPPTPNSAAILARLVQVQTNEALARATDRDGQNQPASFDGAWPRRLIADQAADWLASARDRGAAEEYGQLADTLRWHGLLRPGNLDST